VRTCVEASPANSDQRREKQFAVLPYEEFVLMKERLEDMEDLLQPRKAKKAEGRKRSVLLPRAMDAGLK